MRVFKKRLRPEDWHHGRNCYIKRGCRCAICRAEVAEYARERRVRQQLKDDPPPRPVDDDLGHTWPELVAAALAQQEQKR